MSAAVIVQLNLSTASEGEQPSAQLADKYIHRCIKGRQDLDFIEDADEWTILESFFMFSYYGNRNKSKQAWYYLREAMGFALAMGLDRDESYDDPDLEVRAARWGGFGSLIRPRAYCLQHRTTCQLRASICLPKIYNGCDEPTLAGFITLARLFARIDTDFVSWWSEQSPRGANDKLLNPEHFSAISHTSVVDETQRVDVAVTQCWLRTLVCQLRGRFTQTHGTDEVISLSAAARSLLLCFNATRLDSLESHGIGMEQKISVIAGFLCDLVPNLEPDCLVGDINSIPNLLHEFMCLLSNFRNEESRYLGPLAGRAAALLIQRAGVGVLGPHGDECEEVEDKTLTW
ncbi:Zn(2)-C6 fungal-type domain-containing protein [Fusarium sp. LHS14.1]|nr:Zn(2)-C6 fungal-type domain-containing protein [Fusarium sp. LHS14.1]